MYILQPAIVYYDNTGTYKTTYKSCLWSLLKELNDALKHDKYLIKVIEDYT